jgi:DUF1680 family protein
MLINNNKVAIRQQTGYPWKGQVHITLNPENKAVFTVKLRLPGWSKNKAVPGDLYSYAGDHAEKVILKVNGKLTKQLVRKGYLEITREWKKGDQIELILPMVIHKVMANEKVKDVRNKVAFEYGPIVFCAEEIDNSGISGISIPENIVIDFSSRTRHTPSQSTDQYHIEF